MPDRYVDEVGPRERIAWDRMKDELTAANERCVRLRHQRDELRVTVGDLVSVLTREAANLRITDQSRVEIADRMLEEVHAIDPWMGVPRA